MKRDVKNLKSLGATLNYPVWEVDYDGTSLNHVNVEKKAVELPPHHNFSESIREKYPVAPPDLVEHLGKATFRTWVLLLEVRSGLLDFEQAPTQPEAPLNVAFSIEPSNYDSGYWTGGLPSTIEPSNRPPGTNQTIAAGNHGKKEKSHTAATIAASQRTTLFAKGSLPFPPLPGTARAGEPFDCLACDRELTIRETVVWKWVPLKNSSSSWLISPGNIYSRICNHTHA